MTITQHILLIDLPHGPADIGAEIEVTITFDHYPGDPPRIRFLAAEPKQPFSGTFADIEELWLTSTAARWLEEDGREVALKQVATDQEEMS